MEMQFPDPLKQMRQKQAAEAKQLVAQHPQRARILKEQAKLRAREAAEKQANADDIRTLAPPENTLKEETMTNPNKSPLENPEILPEAEPKLGATTTIEGATIE